jgi:hypothetical protein
MIATTGFEFKTAQGSFCSYPQFFAPVGLNLNLLNSRLLLLGTLFSVEYAFL